MSIAIDANHDVLMCLGFKNRFDLLNIETREQKLLRKIENSKVFFFRSLCRRFIGFLRLIALFDVLLSIS